MRKIVVVTSLIVGASLAAMACGDGGANKQPLTPDTEHPVLDTSEAGAPATPTDTK